MMMTDRLIRLCVYKVMRITITLQFKIWSNEKYSEVVISQWSETSISCKIHAGADTASDIAFARVPPSLPNQASTHLFRVKKYKV